MERTLWTDERIDDAMDRIEQRFDRLETRMDRLEAKMDAVRRDIFNVAVGFAVGQMGMIAALVATR
jgi:hypothetical protein